jgi:predicted lipoprotein
MIRRLILSIAAALSIAGITWVFPLFHIVPLDMARESREVADVNIPEFTERFWNDQLTPALSRAADAKVFLDALDVDSKVAREKYGRTVGVSNIFLVFIQGTGRVVSADSKGVALAIRDGAAGPDLVLSVGMVFGNIVRDATGLLDMNKFSSQDFNDISAELNRIVETRVLPMLREHAEVGREIRFVVCAEMTNNVNRQKPLKVVPLRVELVKPNQPK